MIDTRHGLVKLAALVDREVFGREWATSFPSHLGRPATSPRVVAGLMYLRHAFKLSDEAVVARWVESPYHQHFTGETFFQHRPPIDPSSLTRWRKRIGGEGVEWLLTKTIEAGRASGAVTDKSLKRIAVDATVMEKAIAHPTDARLYERARALLVGLAKEAEVDLRQSYAPCSATGCPGRRLMPTRGSSSACERPCASSRAMSAGCAVRGGATCRTFPKVRRADGCWRRSGWSAACSSRRRRARTRSTPCTNPTWTASPRARPASVTNWHQGQPRHHP